MIDTGYGVCVGICAECDVYGWIDYERRCEECSMRHEEYALCRQIKTVLDAYGLHYTHVPLEEPDPARAAMAKRIGASSGYPDYIVHGRTMLWLEAKAPGGRISDHQKEWAAIIRAHGGLVEVIRSVDDLVKLLDEVYGRPE